MPKVSYDFNLDTVFVLRGETLTVFLRKTEHREPRAVYLPSEDIQVELRVLPDGTPEIYATRVLVVKGFDHWKSMEMELKGS